MGRGSRDRDHRERPPASPPTAAAATLDVQRAERIGTVSPRFLSFGIDISQMTDKGSGAPFDFSRPGLKKLVAPLAPAYIRFSGTKIDNTYYDPTGTLGDNPPGAYKFVLGRDEWDAALDFSAAAGLDVNIGINAGPGPRDADYTWDPDNASELLQRAAADGHPPAVLSFGNEPNITYYGAENPSDYDAADYQRDVDDFLELKSQASPDSKFIGPGPFFSTGEERPLFGANLGPDVSAIMPLTGGLYDAVSFHQYPAFGDSAKCLGLSPRLPDDRLSAEFLDRVDGAIAYMQDQRDASAPGKPLWVDEFGNTACGGVVGYSNTFAAGFYYLNALGSMAAGGVEVASRWTISGPQPYALIDDATLTPRPDYWAALLWHDLMGTTVVRPRVEDAPETLRTFASCTPGADDSVTTLALNTSGGDPVDLDLGGSGSRGGADLRDDRRSRLRDRRPERVRARRSDGDGNPPELRVGSDRGRIGHPPSRLLRVHRRAAGAHSFACGGPKVALRGRGRGAEADARGASHEADRSKPPARWTTPAAARSRRGSRNASPSGSASTRALSASGSPAARSSSIGPERRGPSCKLGRAARRALRSSHWRGRFRTRIVASSSAPDRVPGEASTRLRLQR